MFIVNPFRFAATGYQPAGALFLDGSGDYLSFRPSSGSSNTSITYSFWAKRVGLTAYGAVLGGASGGGKSDYIRFSNNDAFETIGDDGNDWSVKTNALHRDPTAWTNYVVSYNNTSDIRMWVNGTEITSFATNTESGTMGGWLRATEQFVGKNAANQYYSGYLADVICLDGTNVTNADDFGELSNNGIWVPKDPSDISSFGANGFWLDFSDGSKIGKDAAGDNFIPESATLLIQSNTADDSTTFIDRIGGKTITANGDVHHSTDQKKFGTTSIEFDGTGDYLSLADHSDFEIGSGDFTISAFVRADSTSNDPVILGKWASSGNQRSWYFRVLNTGPKLEFTTDADGSSGSSTALYSNTITFNTGTWYHCAVTRQSGTVYFFLDGVAIGNGSNSTTAYNGSAALEVGSIMSGTGHPMDGYIEEILFIKGTALYTSGFTAPTKAYGNDFIPSSIDASNLVIDNCANSTDKESTIYPVIDPVGPWGIAQNTLSNNNLTYVSGDTNDKWNYSTIPISNSDKVYMEFLLNGDSSGSNAPGFNVSKHGHPGAHGVYPGGNEADNWGLYIGNGDGSVSVRHNNTNIINSQAGGSSGDVFMFARHGASAWFGVNGTWYNDGAGASGDPTSDATGVFDSAANPLPTNEPLWIGFHCYGSVSVTWRPYSSQWKYSPPTDYGEMKSTTTGVGNYATLNPIASSTRKGGLSNGNLKASGASKDNFSTMAIPLSGKWYFEATLIGTGANKDAVGVAEAKADQTSQYSGTVTALYAKDGTKFLGSSWESYDGSGYAAGSIIGVYINDGQVTFYKNNTDMGTCGSAFTTQCFATTQNGHSSTVWDLNFGQKPFIHALPDADAKALASHNLTSGYTGSLSAAIVTANATEANIKSTTEGAHSFSNWISFLYNADATEDKIFYASDDASNFIPFADDTVLGKNSFPTLAGSNNWRGCAIATGSSTGIATGTISHTNGGGDSTGAHGLTSPTSRFSILISSESTSSHDGWFWFHPDMTASNNMRLAQGGSEGQQSSKYYAEVTSSNAVVKSAAPTGTYRYIVFAENDLVSLYSYINVSGTDSAYVYTNNKPEWMLWGDMSGGYGQYLAWNGTHNPYNPWTKAIRIHNNSTTEITGSVDILATGLKVREASPGNGAWHQTDGQTTIGISIGTPFPLNNRAK